MNDHRAMGVRRFGRVNWLGLWTLFLRELRRFASVWSQTVLAPVATSILFMLVFALAFGARRAGETDMPFEQFLAPGILMMAVVQNAFANTSSSLIVAKVQGNIVDTLMPPLSAWELLVGYAAGGVARGIACALAIGVLVFPAIGLGIAHPVWAMVFLISGALMLALFGLIAAIYAEKFDHLSIITNFIVTPLSFLSGTFYSISILPEPFYTLSHANPVFYLIDGFRFAVLGTSDSSPWLGLAVTLATIAALGRVAWRWLDRGYRLKA